MYEICRFCGKPVRVILGVLSPSVWVHETPYKNDGKKCLAKPSEGTAYVEEERDGQGRCKGLGGKV